MLYTIFVVVSSQSAPVSHRAHPPLRSPPLMNFLFGVCLPGFFFPPLLSPTVQRHAGRVNWRLQIARRCECQCEKVFFFSTQDVFFTVVAGETCVTNNINSGWTLFKSDCELRQDPETKATEAKP